METIDLEGDWSKETAESHGLPQTDDGWIK